MTIQQIQSLIYEETGFRFTVADGAIVLRYTRPDGQVMGKAVLPAPHSTETTAREFAGCLLKTLVYSLAQDGADPATLECEQETETARTLLKREVDKQRVYSAALDREAELLRQINQSPSEEAKWPLREELRGVMVKRRLEMAAIEAAA
mgnify:CR=1 FL=1